MEDEKPNYWDPLSYQQNSDPQFTLAMEMLTDVTFNGSEAVLDVGCGTGQITTFLANQVPQGHVKGIDYSQAMITFASQAFIAIPNLSFVQADATYFNSNEQYDLITSFSALHWIPEQTKLLANLYDHLKPGGMILITLCPPRIGLPLLDAIYSTMALKEWVPYFSAFEEAPYMPFMTLDEYEHLLQYVGFEDINGKEPTKRMEFEFYEKFALWIQAFMPQTAYLPAPLQTPFYTAVTKKYARLTMQSSTKLIYWYYPFEIVAKKSP